MTNEAITVPAAGAVACTCVTSIRVATDGVSVTVITSARAFIYVRATAAISDETRLALACKRALCVGTIGICITSMISTATFVDIRTGGSISRVSRFTPTRKGAICWDAHCIWTARISTHTGIWRKIKCKKQNLWGHAHTVPILTQPSPKCFFDLIRSRSNSIPKS